MANVRNANTFYIDTQSAGASDDLVVNNVRLLGALVTAGAAGAKVILQDAAGTPVTKMDLRVATDESTSFFDFSNSPIIFPNGIKASTLTDAICTLIIEESRS